MAESIKYSIIVPVCHGGEFLKKTLTSFRGLRQPPGTFELIVAMDETDVEAQALVASEQESTPYRILPVVTDGKNRAGMLNEAWSVATGRLLAFTDDDCVTRPDWLERIDEAFSAHPDAGIIGGLDKLIPGSSTFEQALDTVLTSFAGTGGLRRGDGLRSGKYYPKLWNMAISADVAASVSMGEMYLFHESFDVHEDVELAERIRNAGMSVVFAPDIVVDHFRDTSFGRFIKRSFDMARSSRIMRVHRIPHLALATFSVGLPALAVLSLFFHSFQTPLLFVLLLYTAIIMATGLAGVIRTRNFHVAIMVPIMLVAFHIARGIGYLIPLPAKTRAL